MRRAAAPLLAALAVGVLFAVPAGGAAPAGAAEGRKQDPEAVAKGLLPFLKRRALGAKDPDEVRRRLAPLDEAGLAAVLDTLRRSPEAEAGPSAVAVLRIVSDALLAARWTPAVLSIPDAASRIESPDPGVRAALLADAARLEDAEPATRLALGAMAATPLPLRLRAVDVVADLCSYAGDPGRLLPALRKALEDPSPAVRDLALERLADLGDAVALEWSLDHLFDAASEEAEVRERREARSPGERAFLLLARESKMHTGMEPSEARALSEEGRAALVGDFRAWFAKAGPGALRNGSDGPFDPVPRVTTQVVPADRADDVRIRWWSDIDRAAFQATYEGVDLSATSALDWTVTFRMVVIASGARQGNWESLVRRFRCGERHRQARKGFGLVETTVQHLLDGRIKFHVRAYESR